MGDSVTKREGATAWHSHVRGQFRPSDLTRQIISNTLLMNTSSVEYDPLTIVLASLTAVA